MKIYKTFVAALFLLLITTLGIAQKRTIVGRVTAFKNIPVAKVEVKVKKSKNKTFTDSLGYFKIECFEIDKLSIKARGFKKEWIKVRKYKDSVNVNLVFLGREKDIELASGYGHINKKQLSHSIGYLNIDKLSGNGYSNILEMIQGRIAGVRVVGDEIHIRGKSSFTGSNSAVVVVNGIVTSTSVLKSMSVHDVKSISVLKGTAAAIYGARGANGVIVVKLK